MKNIVVIGSLNVDVLQRIVRLPKEGETLSILNKSSNFGGKGANQAVAAARQGAIVSFIGAVGADSEGQRFIQLLEHEGINSQFIPTKEGSTGTAYIMLEEDGHNTILVHGGANADLTVDDVEQARLLIENADIVLAQLEVPRTVIAHGLAIAKAAGAMTILNPAPVTRRIEADILSHTDLLIPNETEAAALLNLPASTDYQTLKERLPLYHEQLGIQNLIITLGEAGAFFAIGQHIGPVKNFHVAVEDTTAAGDTFIGTIATTIEPDFTNIERTLQKAAAAAAIAVSKPGAIPSIPYQEEIARKLAPMTMS
ncbi:ribokinase [Fructobacillus fructosus]|uniref:ribokinase n=1 Tax=Fructobacillus fructosus TaxID=1631 RepID=UPI002DA84E7A|nr:Sugar or nucleoside kinase [Fructobacillus fructosus]CAK1244363.1 Sugar or nucleoside kinase [Fructobacillus fructosus]CAK1244971.1 Sugar or nucleoside kinase [Fructobacillus fructosus]